MPGQSRCGNTKMRMQGSMAMSRCGGKRLHVGIGLFLAGLFLACDTNIQQNPNENSGDDGERGLAKPLPLNEPVNDNVNYTEGDMTDWKYFQIPAPGTVEVTLGCDYTGAACAANVREEDGVVVHAIESQGQPVVTERFDVTRGNYYLEIYVPAAYTDYTIQVNYEPF